MTFKLFYHCPAHHAFRSGGQTRTSALVPPAPRPCFLPRLYSLSSPSLLPYAHSYFPSLLVSMTTSYLSPSLLPPASSPLPPLPPLLLFSTLPLSLTSLPRPLLFHVYLNLRKKFLLRRCLCYLYVYLVSPLRSTSTSATTSVFTAVTTSPVTSPSILSPLLYLIPRRSHHRVFLERRFCCSYSSSSPPLHLHNHLHLHYHFHLYRSHHLCLRLRSHSLIFSTQLPGPSSVRLYHYPTPSLPPRPLSLE